MTLKILGINHVAVAPSDPDKAKWFFGTVLNLPDQGAELVKAQATLTHFFETSTVENSIVPEGMSRPRVEIVSHDATQDSGPIQTYLQKKGGGIHHIAFSVEDLDDTIRILKKNGVQLVNEVPQVGAHHTRIVFVHPRSTGGILVEFSQSVQDHKSSTS